MPNLPIDWALVNWYGVGTLAALAFVAALIANLLTMGNRFFGAVFTGVFFAILYVAWMYWLRDMAGLPPFST